MSSRHILFSRSHRCHVGHRVKKFVPSACMRTINFYVKGSSVPSLRYILPGQANLITSSFYMIMQEEPAFLSIS